jgi:DNA-binding transcriptional MerR regulator
MEAMRIGFVASRLGVSRDTLRRLECEGIVKPQRDRVGHRRFSEADLERIRAALFRPCEHEKGRV